VPKEDIKKIIRLLLRFSLDAKASKDKTGVGSDGYRTKACFVMRPTDPSCPPLEKLLKIRPHRRISEKDMKEIYPEWNEIDS